MAKKSRNQKTKYKKRNPAAALLDGLLTLLDRVLEGFAAAAVAVLRGIGWLTAGLLRTGRLVICRECSDCLREIELYVWDERGGESVRKENDHAMDDMRYFAATILGENGDFAAVSARR